MIYFILWVSFLFVVVLAVPLTSFLEKRSAQRANPSVAEEEIDAEPTDEAFTEMDDQQGMATEDQFGGEVEAVEAYDDEFAAFEELK